MCSCARAWPACSTAPGSRSWGSVGTAPELLDFVREHRPDLVVVDIRMPPDHTTEGLDAARTIRDELPETAILVLSAHVEVEQATDLLASGERSGYLLKSRVTDVDEFLETLERIVKGGSVVDPALVQELVAARRVDDPLERALAARARGARADGRGSVERGHRPAAVGDRGDRREARAQHPHEAALPETEDDHRRVLAVVTFLDAR